MRISVVTAVYNARDTIADAMESILQQSHADIESIVIDGASRDGTCELLEGYRHRIDTLVSEPDGGIYDALNKGLAHARGEVIGFLHADDVLAGTDTLERVAKAFADPSVDAVYGDLVYVSRHEPGRIIRYWQAGEYLPHRLRRGWMPPHPTFYVRRRVYERLGAFDTTLHIAADYDCMLRFLIKGGIRCRYIPEVLVIMRMGGASNRSWSNIARKSAEDYRAIRRNHAGGVMTLVQKNMTKLPQFLGRVPGHIKTMVSPDSDRNK